MARWMIRVALGVLGGVWMAGCSGDGDSEGTAGSDSGVDSAPFGDTQSGTSLTDEGTGDIGSEGTPTAGGTETADTASDSGAPADTQGPSDTGEDTETGTDSLVIPDTQENPPLVIEEQEAGFCSADGAVESEHTGYTGAGYVNTENAVGSAAEWAVESGAGQAVVTWRYASTSDRPATVWINGVAAGTVAFPSTGSWTTWSTASLSVSLAAGANRLRLVADTDGGLPNIDHVAVAGASAAPGVCEEATSATETESGTGSEVDTGVDTGLETDTPQDTEIPDGCLRVDSLEAVLPYLDDDNVCVVVAPGTYRIDRSDIDDGPYGFDIPQLGDKAIFLVSGSNSTYIFTGVTVYIDTNVFRSVNREFQIIGNNNVVKNLTMIDEPTEDLKGTNIVVDGRNNLVEGFHTTVRGSFPYGYGDAFGKGANPVIGHRKHCGLLLRGERNTVKYCTILQKAYCHGLFMQAASYPTIDGCYIEGEMRSTDDMLAEEGTGSPADEVDFMTVWGYRLPPGYMMSLAEGGIRAYNAGETLIDGELISRGTDNPTVLNSTVVHMRTGVTLGHATGSKYVSGVTLIGCEQGFSLGSNAVLENSYADAAFGPVYRSTYTSDNGVEADITILPPRDPYYNGSKTLAYIGGKNHKITFHSAEDTINPDLKILVAGEYTGIRVLYGNAANQNNFTASNVELNNFTMYPVVLDADSSGCTVQSGGPVTDNGTNNDVSVWTP